MSTVLTACLLEYHPDTDAWCCVVEHEHSAEDGIVYAEEMPR